MKEEILNDIIERTKQNLKESKELMPVFFVGNDKEINIVGAVFDEHIDSKDKTAKVVRQLAKETNATFVLFIAESWTLPSECVHEFMANRDKYPSVSDHPSAFEIVSFMLETEKGTKAAGAKILPGREMGPVTWIESKEFEGRFTGLIPKRATSALH